MKVSQLKQLVKEILDQVDLEEMARAPAKFTISPEGISVLKEMKTTNEMPTIDGTKLTNSDIGVLVTLFKAKPQKLLQKDVAAQVCKVGKEPCQQMVNSNFRKLSKLGLIEEEAGEKGLSSAQPKKKGFDDILGDLEF